MKKPRRKKASATPPPVESHTWWDDDLRQHAAGFAGDLDAVMSEADKLDRWANQLRGYQPARVPRPHRIEIALPDGIFDALSEFKKRHGSGAGFNEASAATALVAFAAANLPKASEWIDRIAGYTAAEGVEQLRYMEAAAKASTSEWRRQLNADGIADGDDDLPGDEWKRGK